MPKISCRMKAREQWLHKKQPFVPKYSRPSNMIRPFLSGTRVSRNNKTEVYRIANRLLNKHKISGKYVGLAEAYADDIFLTLKPHIQNTFVNYERDNRKIEQIIGYQTILQSLWPKVSFVAKNADILDCSESNVSIIDLDLMECLSTPKQTANQKVSRLFSCVNKISANRSLVMIWSCYGMKVISESQYDTIVRPEILLQFASNFRILEHKIYKYCDNHIPIKVELLVISRRHNNRRRKNEEVR
jgi:hypothetical protein